VLGWTGLPYRGGTLQYVCMYKLPCGTSIFTQLYLDTLCYKLSVQSGWPQGRHSIVLLVDLAQRQGKVEYCRYSRPCSGEAAAQPKPGSAATLRLTPAPQSPSWAPWTLLCVGEAAQEACSPATGVAARLKAPASQPPPRPRSRPFTSTIPAPQTVLLSSHYTSLSQPLMQRGLREAADTFG
jgi:hypothetical protein